MYVLPLLHTQCFIVWYSPFIRRATRPWARIAQSLQRLATGWTVRESNPGGGEVFRTHPDRSWVPPILLYNGYRVIPGGKPTGARFPTYGFLKIKENSQSAHLELQRQALLETHFRDRTVFRHVWPGRFTTTAYGAFLQRCWKTWHWDSLAVRAWWCSSTYSFLQFDSYGTACFLNTVQHGVACSSPLQHLRPTVSVSESSTGNSGHRMRQSGLYSEWSNVVRWTVYQDVVLYFRNATRFDGTQVTVISFALKL